MSWEVKVALMVETALGLNKQGCNRKSNQPPDAGQRGDRMRMETRSRRQPISRGCRRANMGSVADEEWRGEGMNYNQLTQTAVIGTHSTMGLLHLDRQHATLQH